MNYYYETLANESMIKWLDFINCGKTSFLFRGEDLIDDYLSLISYNLPLPPCIIIEDGLSINILNGSYLYALNEFYHNKIPLNLFNRIMYFKDMSEEFICNFISAKIIIFKIYLPENNTIDISSIIKNTWYIK